MARFLRPEIKCACCCGRKRSFHVWTNVEVRPRGEGENPHHLLNKSHPSSCASLKKGLADHCCLKIKAFCVIVQGGSEAPWSILVKVLAARATGNNSIELLKHCNEYRPLFLAPLWLWCLTTWVLAASILSLSVRWAPCICCGFGILYTLSFFFFLPLNHGDLLEQRH